MDDNIYMMPYSDSTLEEKLSDPCVEEGAYIRSNNSNKHKLSWVPSYILDFSNLSAGEFFCQILKWLACLFLKLLLVCQHILKLFQFFFHV